MIINVMGKCREFAICRICLEKKDPSKCKTLKPETIYDGKLLLKMLNFCIPEMFIDLALEYPKICRRCVQNLNNMFKFKNMCLKNDLKYKNYLNNKSLNGSENVPSTVSDINNRATPENNSSTNNIYDQTSTDVNQNETLAVSDPVTNQTAVDKREKKRKNLSPYKKRFTNTDCFGCRNYIRDAKYHSSLHNETLACLNCGKEFKTIQEIRKHVHTHLYLYKCEVCGKKWRDRHQLELHLRSHTKLKPFECPECSKRFVQSYNLHQHLSIHKGTNKDNRNRCEKCTKVFSTKYNLKIHLLAQHAGYKPRCVLCNKWFYTDAALKKHVEKCEIIKTENEIFMDEPEFIKTEVPECSETVVPECMKEEDPSDDDVFIEETSLPPNFTDLNIGTDLKLIKKEELSFI